MHQLLNVFILAFGGLQGILLAILLLRQKAHRKGHLFLLLYLLTLLLQIAMKLASKIWLMQHLPAVYQLTYQLPFLYGPLWYLFILQGSEAGRTVQPRDGLHFLPVLLLLLPGRIVWPYYPSVLFFRETMLALQICSLAAYHLACFRQLQKRQGHPEKNRTLFRLSVVSFIVTTTIAIALFVLYATHPRWSDWRYLFTAATFIIYWVSYEAMRRPDFFDAENVKSVSETPRNNPPPLKKYHHSTLRETEIDAILARLEAVMLHRHPYLEAELNIDTLAALAGTNRHHLSQAINARLQQNFFDYLNTYRVKAARQYLADPRRKHLKIAAIAYEAGFNSLSTFNDVFKKRTGHTPSEFRRRTQNGQQRLQV